MRKLIFLSAILGLLFATEFPTSIPGTDLLLHSSSNSIESNGIAVYKNYGDTEVHVHTKYKSQGDWDVWEAQYNTGGTWYFVTTYEDITYYYLADIDYEPVGPYNEATDDYNEYQQYAYCWADSYYNDVFYKTDVYIDNSTTQEALDIAIKVNQAMLVEEEPPVQPPIDDDNDDYDPPPQPPMDDEDDEDDYEPEPQQPVNGTQESCCGSAFILLGILPPIFIFRK